MTDEPTVVLFSRAQGGDQDALNQLIQRLVPRLRRWASGRLPGYARGLGDTNDMVQDILIRACRNLQTIELRGEGALQAYLRQAVLNRIRDEIRRHVRHPRPDLVDSAIVDQGASPLQHALGNQAIERYERALQGLSPQDREAVVARVELGCDYAEVAAMLGKPTAGAARVAVSRALRKLALAMASP